MRILCLDVGDAKIGTAMSDPLQIVASPLGIILRRDDGEVIRDIVDLIQSQQIGTVVVGLPLTLNGTDSEQTQKVRHFTDDLKKFVTIPVVYWNEGLSTQKAIEVMRANGGKRRVIEQHDDAVAAAVVLQEYLNSTGQISIN